MIFKPSSPAAYRLLMEGSAAFADIEEAGIRVDMRHVDRTMRGAGEKIKQIEASLRRDEVYKIWRRVYGEKASLGSGEQLARVIFGNLGVECKERTATGKPKTDAEALEGIDLPFVRKWSMLEKLKKVRNTFLRGTQRLAVRRGDDWFIHPSFNLHLVWTYRSSSSEPNFQNQPVRDKRQAKLIRRAYIPRDGHVLVETDFSSMEFRGCASFWKDSAMVAYASDPKLDIHRDMAGECFLLPVDNVSKDCRAFAKNQFVFPELYGSYYVSMAAGLWTSISRAGLKTKDGVGIYEHLRTKGIRTAKEFEGHIKRVEQKFNERFAHWSRAKDRWWQKYLERGWFPLATGFVCPGIFSYNNLMNTPIQGPSFHCLLWSVIQVNAWLKKNKMRSKIVGQIHDSILADVYEPELQDYLNYVREVMTVKVREHWDWIITPLDVEVDVSDRSWFDKSPWKEENGLWVSA
jgi:DNA polymerase-1